MWKRWMGRIREAWLDRPLKPGTTVGQWRIERMLGEGSYGLAYLAVDVETGERVAMKQVRPSRINRDKGLPMHVYEKRVLEALSDPRIPQVLGQLTADHGTFLILTYIPGPTLEHLLFEHGRVFSEAEAVLLLRKLAEIVAVLHRAGIVHRDVRIPNVIMQDEEPRLIDFGLARFLCEAYSPEPEHVQAYPPVKQRVRRIDPGSDLYAMGHLFLFLLYSGFEAPPGAPERSWEEELTLSPEVRGIIRRLLELDAPYPHVQSLIHDLDACLTPRTASEPFARPQENRIGTRSGNGCSATGPDRLQLF